MRNIFTIVAIISMLASLAPSHFVHAEDSAKPEDSVRDQYEDSADDAMADSTDDSADDLNDDSVDDSVETISPIVAPIAAPVIAPKVRKEIREIKKDVPAVVDAAVIKSDDDSKPDLLERAKQRIEHLQEIDKKLEDLSKKSKKIGPDIAKVAEEHKKLVDETETARTKVEGRSKLKDFFFGTDWKNVGQLRSSVAKDEALTGRLEDLKAKTTDKTLQADLQTQIDALAKVQADTKEFVDTHEKKFSLFGWLTRVFQK